MGLVNQSGFYELSFRVIKPKTSGRPAAFLVISHTNNGGDSPGSLWSADPPPVDAPELAISRRTELAARLA
ncbi:hypothetical protein N7474_004550 [Penicillium riverlandense]|uniref:uncharacterized protein n=1 Tax=Penicillium riverlandense TaxID=1903569 RepID=UPI00254898CD|nr:uncharacterized protein N7474_004550 [Penicillium riverlandense]KAJ5818959.1 hypothetical protein N7474_004550 [Penicillium riverlandense]